MGMYSGTLDLAIQREKLAHHFYTTLAGKTTNEDMRQILMEFANEEMEHRETLRALRGQKVVPSDERVRHLGISNDVDEVKPTADMTYKEAIIYAMKKETDAFEFYSGMASISLDQDVKNTFQILAQEEAKHKLRFEREYENLCAR